MAIEDALLVRQSLEGDPGAFERLVDRYQKVVFSTILRMVNDKEEAEELTQAVFVKLYEKLSTFNPKYKFFSWLYRIVVNESLNYIKQRNQRENIDHLDLAGDHGPDERYEEREKTETVEEAVFRLSPDYRIVIVLRHFHDLSYREMSQILDVSEKTVKSRLFTARQLLRRILVKIGYRQ